MDDEAEEVEDGTTFEAFFASSLPRLLGLARLLTGDPNRAEDLVQETAWRVHRSWASIEHPAAAYAYSRTVMVRLATRWRGKRWTGEHAVDGARLERLRGGDVDAALANVDDVDQLDRALAALPVAQRAVLVLRFYDQQSEAEIARLLHCSPGTVKSRAARALASLRAAGLAVDQPAEPAIAAPPSGGSDV